MKKYLVLGLCLLSGGGVQSHKNIPCEHTSPITISENDWNNQYFPPSRILDETTIDDLEDLIQAGVGVIIPLALETDEVRAQLEAIFPPLEQDSSQEARGLSWFNDPRNILNGVAFNMAMPPKAPNNETFCLKKGAELTINPDGCENIKTITEPGEYTCTAHFQNGVINPYPITLVSGSVVIPEEWPMERTGPVNENDQES